MKNYRHIEVHPSGRVDPDKTTLKCENPICDNEITIGQSYSFLVIFATTGSNNISAFGCKEEQHFACSPRCAKEAAIICIDEHLIPEHRKFSSGIK